MNVIHEPVRVRNSDAQATKHSHSAARLSLMVEGVARDSISSSKNMSAAQLSSLANDLKHNCPYEEHTLIEEFNEVAALYRSKAKEAAFLVVQEKWHAWKSRLGGRSRRCHDLACRRGRP